MLSLPGKNVRHVFPQAPTRAVSLNNGYRMPAWFDLTVNDVGLAEDEHEVLSASRQLDLVIQGEIARGIAPGAIVLAGFSQGGALALFCGIHRDMPVGAIVVLSGWLPCAASLAITAEINTKHTPIFFAHGTYDSVVPPALVRTSRAQLQTLGYDVTSMDYPIEHTIDAQEMADLGAWLDTRLKA